MNSSTREDIARSVFHLLAQHRIEYCLLSGQFHVPSSNAADIDVLLASEEHIKAAEDVLANNGAAFGFAVVRCQSGFLTLMSLTCFDPPTFVLLDLQHEAVAAGRKALDTSEVLRSATKRGNISCAAPSHAVFLSLAKVITRNVVDDSRFERARSLYFSEREDCSNVLTKFFGSLARTAITAFEENDKEILIRNKESLATALAASLAELPAAKKKSSRNFVRRLINPEGFHVAMLGPDGAGKSSVVDVLESSMLGPFNKVHVLGFAPRLRPALQKKPLNTSAPHSLKPRSWLISVLRGLYWLTFAISSHLSIRVAKARNTLLVNDRHFIDILVDPVRYRYGGPRWLLEFIAWVTPLPDAVVLLHGPAEVLQARKKELSVEETARQNSNYLNLVKPLAVGHIVDAAQDFENVVRDVCRIVFRLSSKAF